MTEARKGEIALKLLGYILRKRGIQLSPDSMRELGNVSKAIGVPVQELTEFAKPLYQEMLNECFEKVG